MTASLTSAQLNLRIISHVIFTCICYLSIGLPLAVLPSFVHYDLGYSALLAGAVISIQYIATLISRPHAGRLTDVCGPKKVVALGIICCAISGILTLFAAWLLTWPVLAISLLTIGRVVLGVGESFTATGSILWGIKVVGSTQTGRVISWNGVATYMAMAIGAPLGVWLNQLFGIAGFAWVIIAISALGLWYALTREAVAVATGPRAPFYQVVNQIWRYGTGLALGTIGFGVIATFITLYFSERGWQGAAFTLSLFSIGFIGVRLVLSNAIARHGGTSVALVCLLIEATGLLVIWIAPWAWLAAAGALLAGCGFSLVFPALGVEAVKQVDEQNQGTAIGTFSAFLDLGLGVAGPLAGWLMGALSVGSVYLCAAISVLMAFVLVLRFYQAQQRQQKVLAP